LRQSEAPNPWHRGRPFVCGTTVDAAFVIRFRGCQHHLDNPGIPLRQQVINMPMQVLRASHMSQHACAQAARCTPRVDIRAPR
jgi:hypothetical protein